MKKTLSFIVLTATLAGTAAMVAPVIASAANFDLTASMGVVSSGSSSATSTKKAARLDQATAKLQTRAAKEIDRRITSLNKLETKIQGMKKVTETQKATLTNTVQSQITLLTDLKTKIQADIDAATLKTDVQSITKAYRIYALILPQIEIITAADRLASTTDLFSAYVSKLQVRVTAAQTAGKNVATSTALIADMNAKIADARQQSANAISGVANLVPDNGDKTVMTANTAALKAARADIKTGTQDLKDAFTKDANKIRKVLKDFEKGMASSTSATSTASTTSR